MDRIVKLEEMLKKMPGDSFLQHALGLEHIKAGDDEKALKFFEGIVENDPGYIGTYYHLAKLYERQGNTEKALNTYEKGMIKSKEADDNHTYNELRAAYDELAY